MRVSCLVSGGKDDWFLPSNDELDLMYDNLHLQGVGGFAATNYWGSEKGVLRAWALYFPTGAQWNDVKSNGHNVRAALCGG